MVPNTLFFFAPNNRTWHGASITPSQLDGLANRDARRTFLGFITTSQWQWHHFNKKDTVEVDFAV